LAALGAWPAQRAAGPRPPSARPVAKGCQEAGALRRCREKDLRHFSSPTRGARVDWKRIAACRDEKIHGPTRHKARVPTPPATPPVSSSRFASVRQVKHGRVACRSRPSRKQGTARISLMPGCPRGTYLNSGITRGQSRWMMGANSARHRVVSRGHKWVSPTKLSVNDSTFRCSSLPPGQPSRRRATSKRSTSPTDCHGVGGGGGGGGGSPHVSGSSIRRATMARLPEDLTG